MLEIGIDDAGRGPVIGPMVMAGVLIKEESKALLKRIGVRDSKQLSANRREVLAKEIRDIAENFEIVLIHPQEIDGRGGAGLNLNKIEAIKSALIINKLDVPDKKIKVVIDCPSNNIKKWADYLKQYIEHPENLELFIEHKADVNHVSCSAASILAKTTRDAEIERIKKQIGVDFGSGYPSDPVTKKFLQDYASKHKKDGIFRETWATWQNHKAKKEQKNINDF